MTNIIISEKFKKSVQDRALELIATDEQSGTLNKEPFTKMVIHIGKRPETVFAEFEIPGKEERVFVEGPRK